jgi:hypothetical protein
MSLNRVNLSDYNTPSSSSSTQRVLHCTICNIYPRSLQAYVEHLDIRHRDEEVEVACPVDGCEETFPSVARFKIHIRKIHSTPTNNKSSTATSGLLSSSNVPTIRTNNEIDEASSDDDEDTHRRNSYLKRPKLEGKKRFGTVSRMTKMEPNDSMEYSLKSEDEFADVRYVSIPLQLISNIILSRFNSKIQNGCQSRNESVLFHFSFFLKIPIFSYSVGHYIHQI